jgi:hypothetical protein
VGVISAAPVICNPNLLYCSFLLPPPPELGLISLHSYPYVILNFVSYVHTVIYLQICLNYRMKFLSSFDINVQQREEYGKCGHKYKKHLYKDRKDKDKLSWLK